MKRSLGLTTSGRSTVVDLPVERVRAVVADGLTGKHWYDDAAPIVVRGGVDRLLGGRGRRWPAPGRPLLERGDRVGFWRVVRSRVDELALRAELRLPGTVELVTRMSAEDGRTRITQTVTLRPDGVLGRAYLLADLPAREAVIELVHRRLLRDLRVPQKS